jgi:serine/threonine protein kinase
VANQRYRIQEKLDVGGMAEIYLANAHSVGGIEKQVAIKRVLPNLVQNKRFVAMFLDEARVSMKLTHANIVQVFDVGRADGTYFIVMEYVDGHNLRQLLQRIVETSYDLPIHYAAYIIMEVCKGLAHAHDQLDPQGESLGIVHRDVSPPNVLLSKAGEVKITDFGLAKAVTQLEITDPGIVKGKYSYLSPEAADGKEVDHRADLFAVGILLWETLCKRRLFQGKTDLETVELIRQAEIPSIRVFNPNVTVELEEIVNKALARDKNQRWHSARDLGDALADFLFSNHLKVTNYDLAEMLTEIFNTDTVVEEEPIHRIEEIIEEEFVNLSTLGKLPDRMESDAARPLDEFDLEVEDDNHRFTVSEIWAEVDDEVDVGRADLAALVERLQAVPSEKKEEKKKHKAKRRRRATIKRVALFILWLSVIGGIATAVAMFLQNKIEF